ncbi:HD domain-containing phosphohydrolase [Knoellia koreensis]|uniref:HD domain-containing protein n=1 Tax=Knoellia koreensis TaxID=2730921 RepID=A0A849HGT4_9MICO|nr:HD domain-containing protein [Knoellia sp. DB2414S]
MTRRWRGAAVLSAVIALVGASVVLVSTALAAPELKVLSSAVVGRLALFFVVISLGELARVTILTGRESAPMSTAAALGLATSTLIDPGDAPVSSAVITCTISWAMLVGAILRRTRTRAQWGDTMARIAGAAMAPLLYRWVEYDGRTLVEWQQVWEHKRWLVALAMVAVGGVAMAVDLILEATMRAGRQDAPLLRSIADEFRSAGGLATALATSGALISLGEYALGMLALPLFLFPLALTYFAVQRFASIRRTYRQTIGALSSLTDVAGYTTDAHGSRVAELSTAIGRDLGMSANDLTDLEYAALLHDLGQVGLREPIPHGATVMAAPADQRRIALDGAEIVRTTGVLDEVAAVLEAQTTPYRQVREFGQDLPLSSRIIKVANAYDDLAGPDGIGDERAMERIHLGLGYEYDPRVVESLSRVLARRRRTSGN